MSLKQNNKLKQQQKLTWYIVSAGVAISIIVGIILFFYLNIGMDGDMFAAGGQGYTSHNDYTGIWDDAASWNKGFSWMKDVPRYVNYDDGVYGYGKFMDIYGYITRNGDLFPGGDIVLTVYDTLRVTGNLTIGEGGKLEIKSGGILIVEGNFIMSGGTTSTNRGITVVLGDLDASGSAKLTNSNDFYVFGSSSATGETKFNNSLNNPSNSNIGDETALGYDNPTLYSFSTGSGGTLPVDFQYVKAEKNGNAVKITWATATELNNDFFTIEKSKDAKNFQSIGTVPGAGDSNTLLKYQFEDTNLQSGTYYYRVKQTDFDGQFDYSDIVSVSGSSQSENDDNTINILTIAPNPFEDRFNVDFDLSAGGPVEVSLMNMNGSVVASEVIAGFEGSNRYTFNDQRGLEKGIYLLRITQNNISSDAVRLMKR